MPDVIKANISDLTPDPRNANKGTQRGRGMLDKSLRQYGAGRSILLDKYNRIIAGNKTTEAAADIGLNDVVIVESDGTQLIAVKRIDLDLDDSAARELAYADNRVAQVDLDWDATQMLQDAAAGVDLDKFFMKDELDEMLGRAVAGDADSDPQIDRAAELNKKWQVKRGDLWRIGAHRLLCGDSTVREDVERVMGGEKAQLVFTDPPYGVDYDGGTKVREKLEGDSTTDLYMPCCQMSADFSDEHASLYLWHAGIKGIAAAAAAAAAGYEIRCEIVWNKNQAQYGALSAQYKQKHEPCYYCFKRGKIARWFGPTTEVTVWDIDRASVNEFHPTQKPPELAMRALHNNSELGNVVSDWFAGSGSTLVACQNLQRKCRAIEISPNYCAVILERMATAFPGIEIERIDL